MDKSKFLATDCHNLFSPVGGKVNITSFSYLSTATYSCDEGYVLVGQENRTCKHSGFWSGSPPSCLRSKHVFFNTVGNKVDVFCSVYCCMNLSHLIILLYESTYFNTLLFR